jgi:hypothetical protein
MIGCGSEKCKILIEEKKKKYCSLECKRNESNRRRRLKRYNSLKPQKCESVNCLEIIIPKCGKKYCTTCAIQYKKISEKKYRESEGFKELMCNRKEELSEKRKIYYLENKEELKRKKRDYDSKNREKVRKGNKKRYDLADPIIRSVLRKESRIKYRDKTKAYNIKYRKENKDSIKAYASKYYLMKKEQGQSYEEKLKLRYKRIARRVRVNSNISINSMDMLGVKTINELTEHLENNKYGFKITDNMHIDHIIPLDSATCEEDLIRLTHHTNLQLLPSVYNLMKGTKEWDVYHFEAWLEEVGYNF